MSRLLSLLPLLFSLVLSLPVSSAAQIMVSEVRVTRTAPGQTPNVVTFAYGAMTCNVLAAAIPTTGALVSFDDLYNAGRKCYYVAPGNWSNLPVGLQWSFTVAVMSGDGQWSPESEPYVTGRPNAPSGFGIRPTFSGVAMLGTIQQRFPFAGLDVMSLALDDTKDLVHIGALNLTIPGFSPRVGDRVQVLVGRNGQ